MITPLKGNQIVQEIKMQIRCRLPHFVSGSKEILQWMGYKRDDLTSVGIACKIRSLSGSEFEEYVGSIFEALGFAVEFTPETGDHGIDLILHRGNQKAVVQCKRWEGSVGEPVVRDFLGSMTGMGVKDGFLITTGEYTAQAIEFGKQNGIKLVDLDELLALARKAGRA
jgi:restriction system protein